MYLDETWDLAGPDHILHKHLGNAAESVPITVQELKNWGVLIKREHQLLNLPSMPISVVRAIQPDEAAAMLFDASNFADALKLQNRNQIVICEMLTKLQ
jgi:hypothetical protein